MTLVIVWLGSRDQIAWRTAFAYASGSPAVRTTMLMRLRKFWSAWMYIVGSTGSARPRWRTSPTTPMISSGVSPNMMVFPTAVSPGQARRASSSFTTSTGGVLSRSVSAKLRPARKGMPIALKKSMLV